MTIKEFFSFKQNKFFWINLIAMVIVVALVLFGVLKGLDIYTCLLYTSPSPRDCS